MFMKKDPEIELLSQKLGFSRTLFLEKDLMLIDGKNKKELFISLPQQKLALYHPPTEELLRLALEKTNINIIYGLENVHPKDSPHFVRGGLDQVLCAIAAKNNKIIGFSFSDIINSKNQSQTLARMKFNVKLCQKYKVKTLFSTFASHRWELRSAKDLETLWRVLGGKKQKN